jgi:hypothetical protein
MAGNEGTYGTFEDLLDGARPEIGAICRALRELITELDDDCYEVVWKRQSIASYGVGPKKMSEHYAYIGVFKRHVNLGFYHGASLPDRSALLEGTGKRLRHAKVRTLAQAESPEIRQLLQASIDDRERALG